jgi:hypothetical protein
MTASFGYGQMEPSDIASEFNLLWFIIQQALGYVRTAIPVQVKSVTTALPVGTAFVGIVSVQPLVNQIDGLGNSTPHGTIFNIPYSRLQGGSNAIIMDPAVNDIGLMVVCDRDISSVISNALALSSGSLSSVNPGSFREFNLADGIYIPSVCNAAPTQYIEFLPNLGGINIFSPGGLLVNGVPVSVP